MICSNCGVDSCFVQMYGQRYMDRARRYKLRTGNDNKRTRFLYRLITRERLGVLGRGFRVRLPKCIELWVKRMFPNEDNSPFVGFRESNQQNQL